MIEKLNLKVLPKEKARAADFNRVTGKIDEIIDNLGGGKTYYAECDSLAVTRYKEVSVDDFGVENFAYPVHGTLLSVLFTRGNVTEGMYMKVNSTLNFPVWYGNAPVSGDAIEEGQLVTMVFDRSEEVWRVVAGITKRLPALYIDSGYSLSFIMSGKYNTQEHLHKLYEVMVGTPGNEVFRGNQILMMYNQTYVPVTLVEEKEAYTFEFIYGSKHYEFCLGKIDNVQYKLEITDNGSNIVTQWER